MKSRSRLPLLTMSAGLFVTLLAVAGLPGVAGATVRPLNATGCNGHACIVVTGSASRYTAQAGAIGTGGPYILSVFGPGCPVRDTPVETVPLRTISCTGHGAGKVCAFIEVEDFATGAFEAAGEPCETVS